MKNLAIVHWNDPCFERNVTDLAKMKFAKQVNVGSVTIKGDKVLIVNAVTGSGSDTEYEVTLVHKSLITKIEPLEVKNG